MFGMWRLKHRLKQVEKKFEKALKKLDGKKQEPYEYQELIESRHYAIQAI
jgi:hypothetical protein